MERRFLKNKNFLLTLILGIFTFALCIMFVFLMLNKGGQKKKYNINLNKQAYYAVCTGTYNTLSQANIEADKIIVRKGAGYIVENKGFNVLTSLYITKAEAESVIKKLSSAEIHAVVYIIEIPKINIESTFDYSYHLNAMFNIIDSLCELYYKIDGQGLPLSLATDELNRIIKALNVNISLFEKQSENNMKDIRIKAELKVINNYLFNLMLYETTDLLSLTIKQLQFKILYGIFDLFEEIAD